MRVFVPYYRSVGINTVVIRTVQSIVTLKSPHLSYELIVCFFFTTRCHTVLPIIITYIINKNCFCMP